MAQEASPDSLKMHPDLAHTRPLHPYGLWKAIELPMVNSYSAVSCVALSCTTGQIGCEHLFTIVNLAPPTPASYGI